LAASILYNMNMGQIALRTIAVIVLAAFAFPALAKTIVMPHGNVTITPDSSDNRKVTINDSNTKLTIFTDDEGAKALKKMLEHRDRIVLTPGISPTFPMTYYPPNYYPHYYYNPNNNVTPGYAAGYVAGALRR
jgi:hypothetical protein